MMITLTFDPAEYPYIVQVGPKRRAGGPIERFAFQRRADALRFIGEVTSDKTVVAFKIRAETLDKF